MFFDLLVQGPGEEILDEDIPVGPGVVHAGELVMGYVPATLLEGGDEAVVLIDQQQQLAQQQEVLNTLER